MTNTQIPLRKEHVLAKYTFTESETVELAKRLAQASQRMERLEDEKKSVTSQYKAQIDTEQASASLLSVKISQGYEMRETEAFVELFASQGKKRYYSVATGDLLHEAMMTKEDYQLSLKLDEENAKAEAEKPAPAPEPTPESEAVDEEALGWLTATPASDLNFTNHLERSNLATLRAAHDFVTAKGAKKALAAQIKKLEAAAVVDEKFVWLYDGSCQNPYKVNIDFGDEIKATVFLGINSDEYLCYGTEVANVQTPAGCKLHVEGLRGESLSQALLSAIRDYVVMQIGKLRTNAAKALTKQINDRAEALVDYIVNLINGHLDPNGEIKVVYRNL